MVSAAQPRRPRPPPPAGARPAGRPARARCGVQPGVQSGRPRSADGTASKIRRVAAARATAGRRRGPAAGVVGDGPSASGSTGRSSGNGSSGGGIGWNHANCTGRTAAGRDDRPPLARAYSGLRPDCMTSRISRAVSLGVLPTDPAASSATFFASAVPAEPEMIAPAWPIVLPSGAVKPAM